LVWGSSRVDKKAFRDIPRARTEGVVCVRACVCAKMGNDNQSRGKFSPPGGSVPHLPLSTSLSLSPPGGSASSPPSNLSLLISHHTRPAVTSTYPVAIAMPRMTKGKKMARMPMMAAGSDNGDLPDRSILDCQYLFWERW